MQIAEAALRCLAKCPTQAIAALKPKFAESEAIKELSSSFVMVNVEDDEEPTGDYSPDGGYIPRILFLDQDKKVDESLYNTQGSDKYKFYYSSPEQIVAGMRAASAP